MSGAYYGIHHYFQVCALGDDRSTCKIFQQLSRGGSGNIGKCEAYKISCTSPLGNVRRYHSSMDGCEPVEEAGDLKMLIAEDIKNASTNWSCHIGLCKSDSTKLSHTTPEQYEYADELQKYSGNPLPFETGLGRH